MQATLTSRRDHNFRVNNRKENQVYNNKLITLYERNQWKSQNLGFPDTDVQSDPPAKFRPKPPISDV